MPRWLAATLAGCDKPPPPMSEARPVRTATVERIAGGEVVSLTGQVRAKDQANLAFRLDGRMIERLVNVGDVLRSRKRHGKHHILPLHSDLEVQARKLGFEKLNGIIWQKIGNLNYEQGPGGILGQPGQPNQIIPLDYEHLLVMRRPGPYRSPTPAQREAARISKVEHNQWFRQVWQDIPGARSTKQHPCPFPEELAYRIVRMFSFPADTVLDPFAGSFTTTRGCMRAGRNSLPARLTRIEPSSEPSAKLAIKVPSPVWSM